jgi:murein endopeptidase
MATTITASVGEEGKNNSPDIITIQTLLQKWEWVEPKVTVNGTCTGKADDPTVQAIKNFQSKFSSSPDGRVDPGGNTLKKLDSEPMLQLPQVQTAGYYSYGSSTDTRQWGKKTTIETLQEVSKQFNTDNSAILVGIGDISFQFGGKMSPHDTHRTGIHVDLRPCRKDGLQLPVKYTDTTNYDQEKTKALIEAFLANKNVKSILFNDPEIVKLKGVSSWTGHDDHFHITMVS